MVVSPELRTATRAAVLVYAVVCALIGAAILAGAGTSAVPALIIAAVLGAVVRCSVVLGNDGTIDWRFVVDGAATGTVVTLAAVGAFVLLGVVGLLLSLLAALVLGPWGSAQLAGSPAQDRRRRFAPR